MSGRSIVFIVLAIVVSFIGTIIGLTALLVSNRLPLPNVFGMTSFWRHNTRGNRYYERGDYANAAEEYSAMITIRPDLMDGYELRGLAYTRMHRLKEAVDDFTAVLARIPATARERRITAAEERIAYGTVYYDRGLVFQQMGRYGAAIADMDISLQYYPAQREIHEARMATYLEANRLDEAIADADYVIQYHDGHIGHAYAVRGEAEEKKGQYSLAATDLSNATIVNPENAYYWIERGWFEYEAGQVRPSIITDRKAVTMAPGAAAGWMNLGLSYAVTGDAANAKKAYLAGVRVGTATEHAAGHTDITNALKKYPGAASLLHQASGWLDGHA